MIPFAKTIKNAVHKLRGYVVHLGFKAFRRQSGNLVRKHEGLGFLWETSFKPAFYTAIVTLGMWIVCGIFLIPFGILRAIVFYVILFTLSFLASGVDKAKEDMAKQRGF